MMADTEISKPLWSGFRILICVQMSISGARIYNARLMLSDRQRTKVPHPEGNQDEKDRAFHRHVADFRDRLCR